MEDPSFGPAEESFFPDLNPSLNRVFRPFSWSKLFGPFLVGKDGDITLTEEHLKDKKYVCLFFSSGLGDSWNFRRLVVTLYHQKLKNDPNVEIVYIPKEPNRFLYIDSVRKNPWLSLPYRGGYRDQFVGRLELFYNFSKRTPAFVVLDSNGEIVQKYGRTALEADQEAVNFPWARHGQTFWQKFWRAVF